jgi:uncharacterized protein (DUF1697 family)
VRFTAFLRAINVGGHTVKMDQLRALFESLGFANVATFIASGNVIFEARQKNATSLEPKIEQHLHNALGYGVATFIRSLDEVADVAGYRAFPHADPGATGSTLYVGFLRAPPTREGQQKLLALRSDHDELHLHGRELYWLCHTKSSESALSGALLEKALGMPMTLRNLTTVNRIARKYAGNK